MPSNSICYLFECSLHANSLWIFVSKSIETLQHRIIINHSIQNLILNPDLGKNSMILPSLMFVEYSFL